MIVFINESDARLKQTTSLLKQDGHIIVHNYQQLDNCDLVYLGKDGIGFEKSNFKNKAIVLTLVNNERLAYLSKLKDFKYYYLYRDQQFINDNTLISNEALIAYMIIDNQISLANSKILILGYGNCGKDLAKKLSNFQCQITIANRNYHHYDKVIKQGFSYQTLNHLNLHDYDFIINTIPYPILNRTILQSKKPECKIYDMASAPYGLKVIDRDSNYQLLSQLPAKYATISSGLAMYKAIKRVIDKNA